MASFSLDTIFHGRDRLSATITKLHAKTAAFRAGFNKSMKEMDGHVGAVHGKLSKLATAMGGVALAGGAGLAVLGKAGADFEHTLASLNAVAKPTQEELAKISATALSIGKDFGFSGIEVAKSMEAMSKQGLNVQGVIAGIGGVAAAAAADGSTIEETMGGLLATMAGMGKGAGDLQHIADVMAKAGDATAASIGSLSASMSVFGPTARSLGIPIEAAIGQLAILQDAGIDASSAGTTLSAVYSKLASPTKETSKALSALGLSVKDSFGNLKPPQQLMTEVFKATSKIKGNVGQMAAFTDLVGLNSQKALLNLAGAVGSGKLDKVMGDLTQNVDGYATSIARLKQDSAIGDINKLKASFEALQITIFGLFSKDLRGLVSGMADWLAANQGVISSGILGFFEDLKANLPVIVTWLERIGKVVATFYAFAAAVKVLNGVLAVTKFLAATNPVVLWTYAIIAAIALIWAFWPEISAFFGKLWAGTKEVAGKVWGALTGAWNSVVDATKSAWSSVMGVVGSFFSAIKPYFIAYLEFVVGFWALVTLPARLAFRWIWFAAKIAFAAIKDAAIQVANWVVEKWAPIGAWFSELWGGITSVASQAWDAISSKASEVWGSITGVAQTAYSKVTTIWGAITGFFAGIWDGIASGFRSALDWVLDKLGWIVEKGTWLADLFRDIGRSEMDGEASDDLGADMAPPMFTPAERTAHSIEEKVSSSSGELTIKDETGRAQVSKPFSMPGISLRLSPTGGP